jgi:hypothetical protein
MSILPGTASLLLSCAPLQRLFLLPLKTPSVYPQSPTLQQTAMYMAEQVSVCCVHRSIREQSIEAQLACTPHIPLQETFGILSND